MSDYLLEVENLKVHFPVGRGFHKNKKILKAVDGVSFRLKEGETLGIVGESGCGKSTCGNSIIRLLTPTEGRILFEGKDLAQMSQKELRGLRRDIQMIFQDPFSSLNPRMRVKNIIAEPLVVHKICPKEELEREVWKLMDAVGLPREYADRYPHEFSGGQRQRIGIARALALRPKLIICDEPVSALDVSIQAQVVNVLEDLQQELGLTYLFVAHDLSMVRHISDRIGVMYLGKIVESGESDEVYDNPCHPYTRALLASIPIADPKRALSLEHCGIEGDLPSPLHVPSGCRFHTRCPYATDQCRQQEPELEERTPGHMVACWKK